MKTGLFFKKIGSIVIAGAMLTGMSMVTVPKVLATDITANAAWYYTAFGQSTDLFFNAAGNVPEQNGINNAWVSPSWVDESRGLDFVPTASQRAESLASGAAQRLTSTDQVIIESRGGKIANGHDGMTFFYTKLPTDKNYKLTAKVTKLQTGRIPSAETGSTNNQTGGGMMARDVISANRQDPSVEGFEELPAISNFAGIGFRGNNNNTGSTWRDGCVSLLHAIGVKAPAISNATTQAAGDTLIYELERTNTHFVMTLKDADGTPISETSDKNFYDKPDLVQRVDEENMYWGFYAARETRLLIENIVLEETGTATIAPTTPPGGIPKVAPAVVVTSQKTVGTGQRNYTLALQASHNGSLAVKKGGTAVAGSPFTTTPYDEIYIHNTLSDGANDYTYTFTPNDSEALTNTPVTDTVTVTLDTTKTSSNWKVIWAALSNAGTGSGNSKINAIKLEDACAIAEPGQTIYVVDGDYAAKSLIINGGNGLPDKGPHPFENKMIALQPEPGVSSLRIRTIRLNPSSWHIKGFVTGGTSDTDRQAGTPFVIAGDYNTIEQCHGAWSDNTGINMGGNEALADSNRWPKYNHYINCEAYENKDSAGNNADGFGAKAVGKGNEYRGCIAYHNIDDGWDFFNRVDAGPSGQILIQDCITFNNAHNGFKLGGETQAAHHIVRNSLSFGNGMAGFSDNFNPGAIQMINCTSVDNDDQNYLMRKNTIVTPENKLNNSLSFRTDIARGKDDFLSGTVTNSAQFAGTESKLGTMTLTADMFRSTTAPDSYARDAQGELIWGDYMMAAVGSPLQGIGVRDPKSDNTIFRTVTFMVDGLITGTVLPVASGERVGAANWPKDPSKPGHTFAGWKDAAGTTYTSSTPIHANVVLQATFTPITSTPSSSFPSTSFPSTSTPATSTPSTPAYPGIQSVTFASLLADGSLPIQITAKNPVKCDVVVTFTSTASSNAAGSVSVTIPFDGTHTNGKFTILVPAETVSGLSGTQNVMIELFLNGKLLEKVSDLTYHAPVNSMPTASSSDSSTPGNSVGVSTGSDLPSSAQSMSSISRNDGSNAPKTGDDARVFLFVFGMGLAFVGIVLTKRKVQKQKEQAND